MAAILLAACLAGSSQSALGQAGLASPTLPPVPVPHEVNARIPPLKAAKSALVEFDVSPFPYEGVVPRTQRPFLDVTDEEGRRGHSSARAGVLWEDATYSDKRALLFMPKGFDVRRPGLIVVFLHGNRATLERDVGGRQRVAAQIAEANVNAVLVAPQLAVNANDSSAGRFWESYGFARFIGEAGAHLARLHGDKRTRKTFATLPVVIVAYSGGYVPAAWALAKGGSDRRVLGVLLLDALYGEVGKYADFIASHPDAFFISAYTSSSARGNESLQQYLAEHEHPFATSLPTRLEGTVAFLQTAGVDHEDFVTRAWTNDPIRDVLGRLGGYARDPARRNQSRQSLAR
ncbi:MAG TPA: alpha/beta hydrolase [Hyphomicrobiaceae bacterium]|jgi:hypothetical protein